MQAAVAAVVGRVNMKERHKIQLALKYLKAKLTEYRAEERRKVILYNSIYSALEHHSLYRS